MRSNRISIAIAFTTILLSGVWVAAQSSAPERGIPFRGQLQLNGTPIDGDVELELSLSDDAAGANVLWTTERTVSVSAGEFSVVLGEQSALPQSVFDTDGLFVSVGVVTSPGTVVDIGIQKVFAAFQSVTTANADRARRADNADNADRADVATYAERADDLLIERSASGDSRIRFEAQANDEGSITHREVSNVSELWLSSSDDWGNGAADDAIIFGDIATGTERFSVASNGNTTVGGDLTVNGNFSNFSVSGEFNVSQHNTGGTSQALLTPTARSFCFLTQTQFEDLDSNNETARCRVFAGGGANGTWFLEAVLGTTTDADVWCTARCFSW